MRQLSQSDAARLSGVSQPTIANLVNHDARQPSATTLLRLARALNTTPQFLLFGEGEPLVEAHARTDDERHLLSQFRKLAIRKRALVLSFVRLLTDRSAKPNASLQLDLAEQGEARAEKHQTE
ncbi:helix-turn-helix transcriptional regulator [Mitsuaria sp. WAJ17]|nr:helix-turn-helix transcriptional regulator [Mitsuaria sp. WAJ17]